MSKVYAREGSGEPTLGVIRANCKVSNFVMQLSEVGGREAKSLLVLQQPFGTEPARCLALFFSRPGGALLPMGVRDVGAGKRKRAYLWAYARGAFDPVPGAIYDFCVGRAAQYPIARSSAGGASPDRTC